jgi:hypothetical protein
MDPFKHSIDSQFQSHKGANLFNEKALSTLSFNEETLLSIRNIGLLEKEHEKLLVEYVCEKAIREFCIANQYYNFTEDNRDKLKAIYSELIEQLRDGDTSLDDIAIQHYRKLSNWLKDANPFAEKIYASQDIAIPAVACSEYSPELQLKILKIDPDTLKEPIIDIGCGEHGYLVSYFRTKGIRAFGIDRFASNIPYLTKCDWFEYSFQKDEWGSIISNLGFTNHFRHHHFRKDGNFIAYAKKYMEIISSLKTGGSFYYAPDVAFIEGFLDKSLYRVETFTLETDISSVKLTRI